MEKRGAQPFRDVLLFVCSLFAWTGPADQRLHRKNSWRHHLSRSAEEALEMPPFLCWCLKVRMAWASGRKVVTEEITTVPEEVFVGRLP